jgi:hypothetical protein
MLERPTKPARTKRQRERREDKRRRYRRRRDAGRACVWVEYDVATVDWLVKLGALHKADVFSRSEIGQALTKVVDASKMRGRFAGSPYGAIPYGAVSPRSPE